MAEILKPVARSEYYLAKLCGMEVALPTPITRRELYLAKLCGMAVDLPDPITREDFFLAKLCGMDVALPQPITRLELYMARACGGDVEVPSPVTREEWYWSAIQLSQEATFNAFPFAIQSRAGNLINYCIYGNSVQDGTLSPENPVEVVSVGEKTVNLLDIPKQTVENGAITVLDVTSLLKPSTKYYLRSDVDSNGASRIRLDLHPGYIPGSDVDGKGVSSVLFTSPSVITDIRLTLQTSGLYTATFSNIMLAESDVAIPYEPYGYKIPVTVSGENGEETITNIYLDGPLRKIGDYADYVDFEHQCVVREIKELVLTGEESWSFREGTTGVNRFDFSFTPMSKGLGARSVCTAFKYIASEAMDSVHFFNYRSAFFIYAEFNSLTDFKNWLAQQYADGTPVAVYYVLDTSVSEPITLPEILTFNDATTIDITTAVKPSEMYIKYR